MVGRTEHTVLTRTTASSHLGQNQTPDSARLVRPTVKFIPEEFETTCKDLRLELDGNAESLCIIELRPDYSEKIWII
jgi:hypothetical protein